MMPRAPGRWEGTMSRSTFCSASGTGKLGGVRERERERAPGRWEGGGVLCPVVLSAVLPGLGSRRWIDAQGSLGGGGVFCVSSFSLCSLAGTDVAFFPSIRFATLVLAACVDHVHVGEQPWHQVDPFSGGGGDWGRNCSSSCWSEG